MPAIDELAFLEAHELAKRIRMRAISSVDATRSLLDRITDIDPRIRSYARVTAEAALADARRADAEIAAGHIRSPLHGVPIGIKDLCWTAGVPTAAGMAVHRDFVPTEDATVVRRLHEAGAVILGKLQLTEGAYSDHHPTIEPPRNPWDEDHWTGISSSGSGTALAAGLCYAAIGTDTGGSIRWPSAANGVTGIKPTWGRVSRHGIFPLAPTLDHVGAMARSAVDAGLLLGIIAGADPRDATALRAPVPDFGALERSATGLRIGFDPAWNEPGVEAETRDMLDRAARTFAELGAELVELSLPDPAQMIADWAPACAVEAAVSHEATYPAKRSLYGEILASIIETGKALPGIEYQKINLRRIDFRGRFEAAIADVDLVLMPVQPLAPLSLKTVRTLGEQPELIGQLQRYTCPFDMTGHPTITLPGGFNRAGLPLGFQLVADFLREDLLVRAGSALQSATDWHSHHPVLT